MVDTSYRTLLAFLCLIAILCPQAKAQTYDIKVYSVNDGLPQQQLAGVTQDQYGYMWFATYGDGLARFDGEEFHQHTTRHGLRDNAVYEVFHDSRNRLWTSTESGGLARVLQDTVEYRFRDTPLDTLIVNAMGEQPDSTLWMGTYGGGLYTLAGDSLDSIDTGDGLVSDIVWDVLAYDESTWWVATQWGVSVLHGRDGRALETAKGPGKIELLEGTGDLSVYSIYEVGEAIWLATSDGLRIWEGDSLRAVRSADGHELGYVYDIEQDRDGITWVGTAADGLFRWDGTSFTHISEENGLSSDWIYELFRDRNGRIWAATDGNGANLIRSNAFLRYTNETASYLGTAHAMHFSSDGELWAGTSHGLVRWGEEGFEPVALEGEGLPGPAPVWFITERPSGNLLLVLDDNTILEYDGRTFTDFHARTGLPKVHTIDVLADSRDRLWIAREDGLLRYENGESRLFTQEDGLPSYVIWDVYEGPQGHIWLATDGGLSLYREGGTFRNITREDGLPDNQVSHMAHGPEGRLWAGTSEGIARISFGPDSSEVEVESLGPIHSTHRDDTQFLVFDPYGYLWQGTNAGIHRLDIPAWSSTGELKVAHYSFDATGEGLEAIHKAVERDDRGRLWFGTVDGIIRFDPALAYGDEIHPPVHITAAETGGGLFGASGPENLSPSLEGERSYTHDQDDIAISFAGLDYFNPDQVTYSYRLQGFSEQWTRPGRSRQALFTNLEPGSYRFEVQATNSFGNRSLRTASLSFTIARPFWSTAWFRVLAGLVVLGGIFLFVRMRVHYLERNKLRELVNSKTRDLREALREKEVLLKEVHHRVKNNLAVVSGILQMQEFDAEHQSTREVLKDSQMRIKSISLVHEKLYQSDNLASVRFEEYLEDLLQAIGLTFNDREELISLEKEIEDFQLTVHQAIPASLILNELVTNAYKHAFDDGEEGQVTISVSCRDKTVVMEVRDDGRGLPEPFEIEELNSLGMSLVQTLSGQLGGGVEAFNDGGAVFRIRFGLEDQDGD